MSSDPAQFHVLLEQAKWLADACRFEEAAGAYARLCQAYPENIEAWVGLATALLRQSRWPECLQAAAKALALDARHLSPHLLIAAALAQMGRHGDALRAADAALALAPDNPKALNGKAGVLLNQKRYQEVLPLVERVLQLDPADPRALLNRGVALHGLGQSQAALESFDRLLALEPRHPDALMNRGSVLVALGRFEEALQATDAALEIRPDATIALLNRSAALLGLRRPREALETADRLLQRHSRHIKGLINKTSALLALRNFPLALETVLKVLMLDSYNPDALELQIQALLGLRRFEDAAAAGQALVTRYPDRPAPKLGLAKALRAMERGAEAESWVDAVLAAISNQPEATSLKAEILFDRYEWEAGRALIDRALAVNPGHAQLWAAKSAILLMDERYADALGAVERALALEPAHAQAAINGMAALNELNRFPEALAIGRSLLEGGVRDWQLYANLGGALAGLERFDEARQAFATADGLDRNAFQAFRWRKVIHGMPPDTLLPDLDPRAECLALRLGRLQRGDWEEFDATLERAAVLIEQCLAEGALAPLPPLPWLPLPPELTAAVARSRGDFLECGTAVLRQQMSFTYPARAANRLRIGYVSADFRNHPTAHLMRGLFRVHDRKRYEVCVYMLGQDDQSDYYRQIKTDSDRFVDLAATSNAEAAARIHADGIHILIDLMGYTIHARSEIFALRPAPVQASYLGFPGTMGAPFMPYIIADPIVLPEENLCYFNEQPVYLPECYQVNDRWQEIAETGTQRMNHGLPEQGFIFCCFNQVWKLEPVMFAVWMRILERIPNSVLWLYSESEEVRNRLRAAAAAYGIAGDRLLFATRLPKPLHLERLRLADLFLDTRVTGAHTTASDALWAGLPILTCIGEAFPARVAASLLNAVGMPELITHSLEEYEELAVRLASQPAELAALRAKLEQNRLRTPLFDTERFARHLERAFELMWDRYVRGLPPAPLRVAPLPSNV